MQNVVTNAWGYRYNPVNALPQQIIEKAPAHEGDVECLRPVKLTGGPLPAEEYQADLVR